MVLVLPYVCITSQVVYYAAAVAHMCTTVLQASTLCQRMVLVGLRYGSASQLYVTSETRSKLR
jgi:hypothetical protein